MRLKNLSKKNRFEVIVPWLFKRVNKKTTKQTNGLETAAAETASNLAGGGPCLGHLRGICFVFSIDI